MTELFSDRLIGQIKQKKSLVCVGLDPRIDGKDCIPPLLVEKCGGKPNDAILAFNKAIIDATFAQAVIFKPQMAFYEQYNALDALQKTISYIHERGGLAILDAKRNDIGSTSEAYAAAAFDHFGADAITVNAYFGIDGVLPFMKYIGKGKGIFLLIKTSNPSSGEFQDLFALPQATTIDPSITELSLKDLSVNTTGASSKDVLVRNFILMARLMRRWSEDPKLTGMGNVVGQGGYSSVGGVVGATYPAQMAAVRKEIPKNFILIPGYGAQGGTATDIVHGINPDGLGAIVNASRSIIYAYQIKPYSQQFKESQFADAAGAAARDMQQDINQALSTAKKQAY